MGGETGGIEGAAVEPGGDGAELLAEAAELLVELGIGVGLGGGGGGGEAAVKDAEVAGEGEALGRGAVEEALEETDLVRLGPDPVEFGGRGDGGNVMEEVVVGGGGEGGTGVRFFALNGEF